MKRFLALLCALVIGLGITPSHAATNVRMEVYKPSTDGSPDLVDNEGAWDLLRCDGTDVLNGVGLVRYIAYMSGDRGGKFRSFYKAHRDDWDDPPSGLSWYDSLPSDLPADPTEPFQDEIQDLEPGFPFASIGVGKEGGDGESCRFQARNVPDQSEGNKSHRRPYTDKVDDLRIQVTKYGTNDVIPCGSIDETAGRVATKVWATNDKGGLYHFHAHQETGHPAIGPDQDGNPVDRRFWEKGWNFVELEPGVETEIGKFVMDVGEIGANNPKVQTFHIMQQHAPDQPMIQEFCSFGDR